MSEKPTELSSIATEEIASYKGDHFTKSSFLDISCIRVVKGNETYYNVSKVCLDNGKDSINKITRNKYWIDYYTKVKELFKFDTKNQCIIEDSEQKEASDQFRDLTDDELIFAIKGNVPNKEILGTYFHEILMNFFCEHVNLNYAVKASHLMVLVNEKLHLRNITLEEKIKEQEAYIEKLKRDHEIYRRKINAGFNHERAGSILIVPLNKKHNKIPNHYKLRFMDTTIRPEDHPEAIVINDIYNPQKMKGLVYFYITNEGVSECSYVNGGVYEIKDLDAFKGFVQQLQSFEYKYKYDAEKELQKYLKTHQVDTPQTIGKVFEYYCSIKYKIPLYKYMETESISLPKADRGVDLIDIENETICQCKYYKSSVLDAFRLKSFIDFCREFPDWKRRLYVNADIEFSDEIKDMIKEGLFEVIYVDDFEVPKPKKRPVKRATSPEQLDDKSSRLRSARASKPEKTEVEFDELTLKMREFIKRKLEENEFVYLNDMIQEVNSTFTPTKYFSQFTFTHTFSDLYAKTRNGTIPRDKNNVPILIRETSKDEEIAFIRETIGNGEMEKSEYLKLHNAKFHTNYNDAYFTRRFGNLFVHQSGRRALLKRMENGVMKTLLKLI